MAADTEMNQGTRMLFLGEDSLADGFRLIGFETFPDPKPEDVDKIFRELIRNQEKAFAIVDDHLMQADIPGIQKARKEGGRIVIASVPPLRGEPKLASDVAERLNSMFGNVADGT